MVTHTIVAETGATSALIAGLAAPRLIAIGIGTVLAGASGAPLYEAPDFPAGAREFTLGHVAELGLLQVSALDWVVLAPPPTTLDPDAPGTGRFRFGDTRALPAPRSPMRTLAAAVVAEIEQAHHHRALVAVSPA